MKMDKPAALSPRLSGARLAEIAKELSDFGLAISLPHAHTPEGALVELPTDLVSLESDLQVTFVRPEEVPGSAIPVGWRWVSGELRAFASCCGNQPPSPPPLPRR